MPEKLIPTNTLEEKLQACQTNRVHWPTFVSTLLQSQIFVLLDGDVGEEGVLTNPLTLATPNGYDVIALFTAPERSSSLARKFPQYGYGLLTDARWLLERINPRLGIVINPGWDVGLEMPPAGFAKFKRDVL